MPNERELDNTGQTSGIPQTPNQSNVRVNVGVVIDVILNESHPAAKGARDIGAIQFKAQGITVGTNNTGYPKAYPIDPTIRTLPTKNELVHIHYINEIPYYSLIVVTNNPSVTANPNQINSTESDSGKNGGVPPTVDIDVAKHKTTTTNGDKSQDNVGFGKYYQPIEGLHKLKLYEGDTLIESKFGQSIRLSGYNNTNKRYAPSIIIRNGETTLNYQNSGANVSVDEDINRDGSVISMSSGETVLNFQPGTIDKNGSTNFETKKILAFTNYPAKLDGNQILLNSDRIILSAKSSELIFYSKKNYGFISDGNMSIDNKLGINANVGGKINIKTNGQDINFRTSNGHINLGDTNLEPLVMGNKLVQILEELIEQIKVQQYLTPAGPSKPAPQNVAQFDTIKGKLKTILSGLNSTS